MKQFNQRTQILKLAKQNSSFRRRMISRLKTATTRYPKNFSKELMILANKLETQLRLILAKDYPTVKMETLASTWVSAVDYVRDSVITFKFTFPSRGSTQFNLETDSEQKIIYYVDGGGKFGKFRIPTLIKRIRDNLDWGLENL